MGIGISILVNIAWNCLIEVFDSISRQFIRGCLVLFHTRQTVLVCFHIFAILRSSKRLTFLVLRRYSIRLVIRSCIER